MDFNDFFVKKSYISLSFLLLLLIHGCVYRVDRVKIEGDFRGNPKAYIFLSKFEGGELSLIDSVKASSSGHFKFKLVVETPNLITIGLNRSQTSIILLIQPGENLIINSESLHLDDYTVSGSHGSALLCDLALSLRSTKYKIDSLKTVYDSNIRNLRLDSIKHVLDSSYHVLISNHRNYTYKFIKANTFSLASIFALCQSYDSTHPVFDYAQDRKLFRLIDSSLLSVYSSNLEVKDFHAKIQRMDSLYELRHKRDLMFKVGEVLPNVGYPLITGENLFISGIWYKYILIDFWGDWCNACQKNNVQLRDIYKEYAPKGLVVLQVSVGMNADSLKTLVARDSMFWYHASITDMYHSNLLDTLKVTSLPSSYIADRWGSVKAVNCSGDLLKSKLKELLPK